MTDEKSVVPVRRTAVRPKRKITRMQWLLILALAFLLVIIFALFQVFSKEVPWQLRQTAQTEFVGIELISPTSWNVGTALICVPATPVDTNDASNEESVCGSSNWEPLQGLSAKQAPVLELRADESQPIRVEISSGPPIASQPRWLVQMTLRRDVSLGILRATADEVLQLPSEMNLFWRPVESPADAVITILPFSGTTTVGHDVNSKVGEMLRSGKLAVFSASDESLTGRSLAEESALALGDSVRLGAAPERNGTVVFPKGFIRFTSLGPQDDIKVMDIAMFARAEGVKVDRYGGGAFSFEANWWLKVKHQSSVVIAVVLLTGILTLVSALLNIIQAIPDIARWMRRSE